MKSVEDFLAHAVALEEDSALRFDELADALDVHNNAEVTEIFRKMAHYSRLHLREARDLAEGRTLPHIRPWEFEWPDAEAPETPMVDGTHYLMTPHHALKLALDSEIRGRDFYQGVADKTENPRIRDLALEFAGEESEHVALLDEMLTRYPRPEADWDEDMDPPVVVD
ncbi:ferritin-like domain-containing protein [Rhodospirillum rubrum]|uniref:Rubrerythrin n=1 Tax=Rhodospirillum rubrum (strain ATCC 11170 / ATH 1.1.1 / DSM 467 / LMG 4362 / NCIMB 8255 / S1) TaxID=269796 RepID=Q2RQS5_RHORT|nr:ferritin family protein [Rhodospirillum rubrum]ABC23520.1 Rubrerythrin [Rhodospirillum rubrum ATCC 11170]AEO49259.1 rubrerythrin [Rhodospirillum rubrum F11]MBK1664944.1 rubrerythrin [Rhodospirillum rubrum]MBK1677210.1 rubrerythrin [Rhodospirillum rubrum]MBK5955193.1 rubrerythrin [Rhodospirillum rubrum]